VHGLKKDFFAVTEKISDLNSLFPCKTFSLLRLLFFLAYFGLWSVTHSNRARFIFSWTTCVWVHSINILYMCESLSLINYGQKIHVSIWCIKLYSLSFNKWFHVHVYSIFQYTSHLWCNIYRLKGILFQYCLYQDRDLANPMRVLIKTVSKTNSPFICNKEFRSEIFSVTAKKSFFQLFNDFWM
jgi:hypothetical protein